MGGALTREKIVASCSKRIIIVIDETKLVKRLGENQPIPIEILPFAARFVASKIEELGGRARLREGKGKVGPVVTDNGNYILDVIFGKTTNLIELNQKLKLIPGVVETGLFLDMADFVYVGQRSGKVMKLNR